MPVLETKKPSSLKIKYDCGLDNDGKTIVKNRTYSNLSPIATSQDILDIANALNNLQQHASI
ncbi:DUF1659 domain-containing protein [Paraclostridium bifermentans]|uniref:DUF1659 domain-containing protein n=1 Tax=Paraclostridium bifermentans TaxID=1490 RepID=UPI00359C1086